MKIYYEDESLIVVLKPYGVGCEASQGKNMIDLIKEETGALVYPVHRLDTTTTGIMVFAKTKDGAAGLSRLILEGKIKKEYLALCYGHPDESGEMTDFLYHDKMRNKSFVTPTKRKGSKEAKLEFCTQGSLILENGREISLVKINLLTGRTHQIRVQLSSRGYPLCGDGKYGARDNFKIALHAYRLSFPDLKTGAPLEFYDLPREAHWSIAAPLLEKLEKQG